MNGEVSRETSEFPHDSLGLTGFIFRSCTKAGRIRSSHQSQMDGTTRAVAWNREYLRTCRFEFKGVCGSYSLELKLIVIVFLCMCWKINVMNFFVKGDNLSLCLYHAIRTFYLHIPRNPSAPRDSWRLGGYP